MSRRRNARALVLLATATVTLPMACQLVAGIGGERVDSPSSDADAANDAAPFGDGAADGARACGAPPDPVVQVAAGATSACAVTRAGLVLCWGDGSAGQLAADPTTLDGCGARRCSAKPLRVGALGAARSVAVGVDVACAVERGGGISCWGADDEHQLGASSAPETTCTAVDKPCRFAPARLAGVDAGDGDAAALSVSGRTGCAVFASAPQLVNCWGSNTMDMLGQKAAESAAGESDPTPWQVGWFDVNGNPSATDMISVNLCSRGDRRACHGCIVSEGDIACWGGNATGELGHNPVTDPECDASCNDKTILVTDVYSVVSVASGDGASCAVRDDGHVFCWGTGTNGQIGVPDAGPPSYAWQRHELDTLRAASIDGRARTFCAVTSTGEVFCWGRATDGEVGVTDAGACEAGRCARLPTPIPFPSNVKVRQVSVGDGFALALGTDGVVYAWGSNAYGRLGHPPGTAGDVTCGSGSCNPTPTPVCW